jgi:uncharacterized membrane protein YhaH (DUF805 family)
MISSAFSLKGRVRRWHFIIATIFLNAFSKFLVHALEQPGSSQFLLVLFALILWPSVTLMVQRAHDSGRDGKFVAVGLSLVMISSLGLAFSDDLKSTGIEWTALDVVTALVIGAILLLGLVMTGIVTFAPGDPESNEFGPNPRFRKADPIYAGEPGAPADALIDLAARRGFKTSE